MQLTLTHNDVTKALCLYLQTQGMTAFDPNVVTAEFAFKRGSKELICTLDTEAPVAVVAEAPKPSAEIPAATTSASVAEVPETAPAVAAETPAEPASTQVAEAVATTAETQELATAGGDDDNLFD